MNTHTHTHTQKVGFSYLVVWYWIFVCVDHRCTSPLRSLWFNWIHEEKVWLAFGLMFFSTCTFFVVEDLEFSFAVSIGHLLQTMFWSCWADFTTWKWWYVPFIIIYVKLKLIWKLILKWLSETRWWRCRVSVAGGRVPLATQLFSRPRKLTPYNLNSQLEYIVFTNSRFPVFRFLPFSDPIFDASSKT